MGSLLVITGPPGAGKSTVAALVAQRSDPSVLVEGDAFFGFLDRGAIAPWLPAARSQNDVVTRAAGAAAGRFASTYTTVFDGVVGPWFLPTFATATGLAALHYVILLPSADDCVRRVATRPDQGFTDEPATRKMHEDFHRAEIADRHVVRNPPGTADEVADVVVERFAAGSLVYEV
jgi:predicted ABC-type ATPase